MVTVVKKLAKIDSMLLVKYILCKYGPMSQMKVQKLVFYVQAFHLSMFDTELIDDQFEAWVHGPVSRKIFTEMASLGGLYDEIHYTIDDGIDPLVELPKLLTLDQFELVDEVLGNYTPLTGSQLEHLTRSEDPWIIARKVTAFGDPCHNILKREDISMFYKTLLYDEN